MIRQIAVYADNSGMKVVYTECVLRLGVRLSRFGKEPAILMELLSIETTPNPNSMKLNFDVNFGSPKTYTAESVSGCPEFVARMLEMKELVSVFVCADFVTLNKDPRADWRPVLERATSITATNLRPPSEFSSERKSAESDGQVHAFVQMFKGIPIQVKIVDRTGEDRVRLGEQFDEAVALVQSETGADFLKERFWADYGLRYGSRAEVASELADEIRGMFDQQALQRVKSKALGGSEPAGFNRDELRYLLRHEDWHQRLQAVYEMSNSPEFIPLLINALNDDHPQVRRMAAASLGAAGSSESVSALCSTLLNDSSAPVRRTAGDALSDIGDPGAEHAVCKALSDPNKLVRWRAARFLCELGTSAALPFLENAALDSAFEVRLEVEAAKQRISKGTKGSGPAWKRIIEQG